MATYDKAFFIQLKDKWKLPIIECLSKTQSKSPFFMPLLRDQIQGKGNYLVIGCKNTKCHDKYVLKKVSAYHCHPNTYDIGMLKEINSTTKQEILDSIGDDTFTKTFINDILNIIFEYDTNRLQKEETTQPGREKYTGCIVYGCSDGIKYAAGRSCDQASVISQEKRTRKPKVCLSVRNGQVYSTAW